MARLDVRRLKQVRNMTLVVEMQAELLVDISTVVVVPLTPLKQLPAIPDVNPVIDFEGQKVAVRLEQIISVPRARLGETIGNVLQYEYQIMRALDRLVSRT